VSKALDYIKAALQIAFSLVVLAIILLNFRGLHLAVQKFLERAASVSAIKGFGIEVIWTQPELTARSPPRMLNGRSST
jgi:hypothetical protein